MLNGFSKIVASFFLGFRSPSVPSPRDRLSPPLLAPIISLHLLTGRFLWRHDSSLELLQGLRKARFKVRARVPEVHRLRPGVQIRWTSSIIDLSTSLNGLWKKRTTIQRTSATYRETINRFWAGHLLPVRNQLSFAAPRLLPVPGRV